MMVLLLLIKQGCKLLGPLMDLALLLMQHS